MEPKTPRASKALKSAAEFITSPLAKLLPRSSSAKLTGGPPLWPADGPPSVHLPYKISPVQEQEALPLFNSPTMNSINGNSDSPARSIRAVPAEPLHLETSSPNASAMKEDSSRHPTKMDSPANPPAKPYTGISSGPPLSWQNNLPIVHGLVRARSSELGAQKTYPNSSTNGAAEDDENDVGPPSNSEQHWSSAMGRGQGKSGRVIQQLTNKVDALQRELKVERLHLQEAQQAQKMSDSRVSAMMASMERDKTRYDHNIKMIDRRDHQLMEARHELDLEKEKGHKKEDEAKRYQDIAQQVSEDCKRKVAEANEKAAQAESAYNVVSMYWPKEKAEANKIIAKLRKDIDEICLLRKEDDVQISKLHTIAAQQATQMDVMHKCEADQKRVFAEYKAEREKYILGLEIQTRKLQDKAEKTIEEAVATNNKLKWALGVHNSRQPTSSSSSTRVSSPTEASSSSTTVSSPTEASSSTQPSKNAARNAAKKASKKAKKASTAEASSASEASSPVEASFANKPFSP